MFWKYAWAHAHGGSPCGPRSKPWRRARHDDHGPHHHHSRGGGAFGVRRPLRFMARQLDLDEEQVEAMAAILDDLKTERAQAKVDDRKTVATIADAFLADAFDGESVAAATESRADSRRRVEEAVARALERTFALLDPDQRKRLSYLLRSGQLSI